VARRMIVVVGLIAASLWTAACTETRPLGSVTGPIQVLVWNNALVYGHASRVQAIPYLKMRESSDKITFDTTYAHTNPNVQENVSDTSFDASVFTDQGLEKYDVVMFLNTTGNTLDDSMKAVRRQALQDFIEKKGRGFVGIHSATDTYQKKDPDDWPWYVDFIGTNWVGQEQTGTPGVAQYFQNMTHPILTAAQTPNPWSRSDEWFIFAGDPLFSQIPGVKLLLTAHDQLSSTERPSAWIHEMPVQPGAASGGRLFYTAFGHATSTFTETAFIDFIVAGIKWAAGRL
jgi:type 1 glutamine amidotransferase